MSCLRVGGVGDSALWEMSSREGGFRAEMFTWMAWGEAGVGGYGLRLYRCVMMN